MNYMFGNLFGSKPKLPDGQLPQPPDGLQPDAQITQPSPDQYGQPVQQSQMQQNSQGAPGGVPQQSPQNSANGVVGSRMDPAFRQNLSALSHLDQRTTQVLLHAQEEVKRVHQQMIEPEQLLIGLLYDEGVFKLLEDFAIDVAGLLREVQSKEAPGNFTGQPMLGNDAQQIFEKAYLEAKKREAAFVTPEDVLLTIMSSNNKATGYLNEKGLKKEKIEEKLTKSSTYNFGKKSILEKFGLDLTEEARSGKLDPIAGRDKEIERMIHILLRRTKNNPVIIGEAGVGKTAVVEGLAEAIAGGKVPEALKNKRIIQLEMSSLVAGASHRGEFEERLRGVINEVMASSGQLVLFIDEVHTVMGAGDDGAMDAANIIKPNLARGKLQIIGATTTAEYRKHFEKDKAFERRFQPILVDEPSEEAALKMMQVLRPKFEKFHQVNITDEALEASVKLSKKYIGERYLPDKAVDLLDEASAEVKLAHSEGKGMSYTSQNRREEEEAKLAKAKEHNKAEIVGADGKVVEAKKGESDKKDPSEQAKQNQAAQGQKPEQDPNHPSEQANTQQGVQPGQPQTNGQPNAWNSMQTSAAQNQPQYAAYQVPGQQQQNNNGMTQPNGQGSPMQAQNQSGQETMQQGVQINGQAASNGQQAADQSGATQQDPAQKDAKAQTPDGKDAVPANPNDPNAQKDAVEIDPLTGAEILKKHEEIKGAPNVTQTDIENVVSNWTGIPITKLTEDESEKLLKLEDRIHQRLIDQQEAVKAVSEAVRRGRIGLASGNRPIASFIFLGPTGTGKTELAKTLAEILFGKDDAMVRLDMSEYMEKHEVAKLIGAPPGYVGYEEGGQLTEAVRAKPYSIVLLDEVEKAHPDVFNILLQLLEDGRVTDNKGNTISFKNTIIICTSNIGSALITQMLSDKDTKTQKTEAQEETDFKELSAQVTEELRKFFRPELLNRFDDIVIFKPLRRQDMSQIAKLGIDKTAKLLKEQKYAVQITEKALAQLALEGYDPVYGARPLRRLIQTSIENPIALALISKQFAAGDTIVIDYDATKTQYVFRQGEKKKEDNKDDLPAGKAGKITSEAGKEGSGVTAQDNNGKSPDAPGQPQYPDWVKQALDSNGQPAAGGPQNPVQPGGAGAAQSMPGDPSQAQNAQPQQPQAPSLVDQMTQPAVEAPFDPLALVGNTPPPSQPQNNTTQPGSNGTMMQRAD